MSHQPVEEFVCGDSAGGEEEESMRIESGVGDILDILNNMLGCMLGEMLGKNLDYNTILIFFWRLGWWVSLFRDMLVSWWCLCLLFRGLNWGCILVGRLGVWVDVSTMEGSGWGWNLCWVSQNKIKLNVIVE